MSACYRFRGKKVEEIEEGNSSTIKTSGREKEKAISCRQITTRRRSSGRLKHEKNVCVFSATKNEWKEVRISEIEFHIPISRMLWLVSLTLFLNHSSSENEITASSDQKTNPVVSSDIQLGGEKECEWFATVVFLRPINFRDRIQSGKRNGSKSLTFRLPDTAHDTRSLCLSTSDVVWVSQSPWEATEIRCQVVERTK